MRSEILIHIEGITYRCWNVPQALNLLEEKFLNKPIKGGYKIDTKRNNPKNKK